jgi:hypothetical protein
VQDASREIQHMQKAMTTMNLPLANVISDVSGETGHAIIRAILKGQRNPRELAKLRDYRIKASEEEIACSLEGHWQEEVLFELQQSVDRYDFCQRQIAECDRRLQKCLAALPSRTIVPQRESKTDPAVNCPEGKDATEKSKKKKRSKPRDKRAKVRFGIGIDAYLRGGSDHHRRSEGDDYTNLRCRTGDRYEPVADGR